MEGKMEKQKGNWGVAVLVGLMLAVIVGLVIAVTDLKGKNEKWEKILQFSCELTSNRYSCLTAIEKVKKMDIEEMERYIKYYK